MALYEPVFRGFGPGSSELHEVLVQWQQEDGVPTPTGHPNSNQPVLPVIEEAYTDGGLSDPQSATVGSLRQRALSRLMALVQWKKSMELTSLDDFERG